MGAKNVDRIPVDAWRIRYLTVAELARDHVEVQCGLNMPVDLGLVARVSGPATSFWNRKARCKRLGSDGFVDFQAKFHGTRTYQPRVADDQERDDG